MAVCKTLSNNYVYVTMNSVHVDYIIFTAHKLYN